MTEICTKVIKAVGGILAKCSLWSCWLPSKVTPCWCQIWPANVQLQETSWSSSLYSYPLSSEPMLSQTGYCYWFSKTSLFFSGLKITRCFIENYLAHFNTYWSWCFGGTRVWKSLLMFIWKPDVLVISELGR